MSSRTDFATTADAGSRPRPLRRNRRGARARALAIGTIASLGWAAVASAEPPYEPNDSAECHPYGTGIDDCGFYPDPPAGGSAPDNDGDASSDCDWSQSYPMDIIKLTADGIDFGDSSFFAGAPLGPGSVHWSVPDCDFYTAELVGTIHLDGVSGMYGRMHVSYWWNGELLDTRHSTTVHAPSNSHVERAVNLSPFIGANVDEVHVCTELSDNGVDFDQVTCKTRLI